MATSILDDRDRLPSNTDLDTFLGRSRRRWDEIREFLEDHYPPLTDKWSFPGAKYGWTYRLIQKKRTILYMIPNNRHFLVAFVLGDRAVEKALSSDIPASIKNAIRDARRYAEGTGFRFVVRTKSDVEIVKQLVEIKMAK